MPQMCARLDSVMTIKDSDARVASRRS